MMQNDHQKPVPFVLLSELTLVPVLCAPLLFLSVVLCLWQLQGLQGACEKCCVILHCPLAPVNRSVNHTIVKMS